MITFIGNNANQNIVTDGGRLKMRLFLNLLEKEGQEVSVIELDGWKKHFLRIIIKINEAIKRGDNIIIMAGPKGCRFIIPIVCRLNKKHKSRVVYCPVGIGTFDKLVKKMSQEQIDNFMNCRDFYNIKDKKMQKYLAKMDFVCPENLIQDKLYKAFYKLKNTTVVENFRDIKIEKKNYSFKQESFNIIYASRIKEYKGILDLMEVVNYINKTTNYKIHLDIYGDNQLQEESNILFQKMLNADIIYKGTVTADEIAKIIKHYDLFCLPTKYYGEGTSGALVEALISGTPALVSSYSQSNILITDNSNGFIFKIGSKKSLRDKLLEILNNKQKLESIGLSAQETAKKYTYEYNKDSFIKIMVGDTR